PHALEGPAGPVVARDVTVTRAVTARAVGVVAEANAGAGVGLVRIAGASHRIACRRRGLTQSGAVVAPQPLPACGVRLANGKAYVDRRKVRCRQLGTGEVVAVAALVLLGCVRARAAFEHAVADAVP